MSRPPFIKCWSNLGQLIKSWSNLIRLRFDQLLSPWPTCILVMHCEWRECYMKLCFHIVYIFIWSGFHPLDPTDKRKRGKLNVGTTTRLKLWILCDLNYLIQVYPIFWHPVTSTRTQYSEAPYILLEIPLCTFQYQSNNSQDIALTNPSRWFVFLSCYSEIM